MKALLNSAHWPNLHYLYYLLNSEQVTIDDLGHYQKQSYRNRFQILSANGPLDMQVPIKHKPAKQTMQEVEINYKERWQARHWGAITSAYRNSPYFEFFEEEISWFYTNKTANLAELNALQLKFILKALRIKKEIVYTSAYVEQTQDLDLREQIHPKIDFNSDGRVAPVLNKTYYQTFGEKFAFVPNLSALDLLFNTGLEATAYLKAI